MQAIQPQVKASPSEYQTVLWIFALTLIGAIAASFLGSIAGSPWITILFTAAIFSMLIPIRWPYGALLALFAASAIPGYPVRVFSLNVRAEQFVVLLVALGILIKHSVGRQKFRLDPGDYLLLAFVLMNYVGSAINSPDPSSSLRWALLSTLAISAYFLITRLVNNPRRLLIIFKIFMLVGTGQVVFGLLSFISHQVFGTNVGVGYYITEDMWAINGSHMEANIFGSYSGSFAAMFLVRCFFVPRHRFWHILGFSLSFLGCLFSLSRGAWIGLLAGFFVALWYCLTKTKKRGSKLVLVAAIVIVPIAGMLLAQRYDFLSNRIATMARFSEEHNFLARQGIISLALEQASLHPWIGWGSGSYGLSWQQETSQGAIALWVANLEVRLLHDTGAIGLVLFLLFLGRLFRQAFRAIKKTRESELLANICALLSGWVVLLVAFQATDATALSFSWVHLGLLAAATHIALSRAVNRPALNMPPL